MRISRVADTVILTSAVVAASVLAMLPLAAQTSQAPSFEVASVRLRDSQPSGRGGNGAWSLKIDNGVLLASNVSLRDLFTQAYKLKRYEFGGGPSWMDSATYDISAKPPGTATSAELLVMLRALLADRFHLKFHTVEKEVTVLDLVVGKNGPKFQKSGGPADPGGPPATVLGRSGMLQQISFATFVNMLDQGCETLDAIPVMDRTGLPGEYDLRVDTVANPSATNINGRRSLVDQLCEALPKLGLELKRDRAPITMYIVDSADKMPTEN